MESDHEFAMEPIEMSDQDYRELTCVGHEEEIVRFKSDQSMMLRCKHCHKELAPRIQEPMATPKVKYSYSKRRVL